MVMLSALMQAIKVSFCMGKCQQGVCVTVDDTFHSVTPETVEEFFEKNIKAKV